jgi:PGF-pre-PGF domain-containing protein
MDEKFFLLIFSFFLVLTAVFSQNCWDYDKANPLRASISIKVVEWQLGKENIAVTKMNIRARNQMRVPKITVNNVSKKPVQVTPFQARFRVYQYLNITPQNIQEGDLEEVKLRFKVSREWIISNNIDEDKITLNRYVNGAWNKLSTSRVDGDTDYLYFEAKTPGFSYFAISGEQETLGGQEEVTTTTTIETVVTTTTIEFQETDGKRISSLPSYIIIVVLAISTLFLALVYFGLKEKSDKKDNESEEKEDVENIYKKLE